MPPTNKSQGTNRISAQPKSTTPRSCDNVKKVDYNKRGTVEMVKFNAKKD